MEQHVGTRHVWFEVVVCYEVVNEIWVSGSNYVLLVVSLCESRWAWSLSQSQGHVACNQNLLRISSPCIIVLSRWSGVELGIWGTHGQNRMVNGFVTFFPLGTDLIYCFFNPVHVHFPWPYVDVVSLRDSYNATGHSKYGFHVVSVCSMCRLVTTKGFLYSFWASLNL
jgi:hypothetical protein